LNYLGLEDKKIENTVGHLNELLASFNVYYQNLRNFHWNIQGADFFDLHTHFESLYNEARLRIDAIAERVLTLRHRPISNFSIYLKYSKVQEAGQTITSRGMIEKILYDHMILIEEMRETIRSASEVEDEGTVDLIAGFLREMEKASWMLDSWLVRLKEPVSK